TRTALKWGVIIGIICTVFGIGIMVAGQLGNKALGYLAFVFVGVGIYLAVNDFKKENQGFITYGQGLGLGTMKSAIVGLLASTSSFLYTKFIDPSIPDQTLKLIVQDLEKKGTPDEQIDQMTEMMKMGLQPGVLFVSGIFMYFFIGFVLSLIIAAILKKEKPVFE
ncbi:MAG: hypothetical protein RLZZ306_2201, partial [Bacteroidota bacterium]